MRRMMLWLAFLVASLALGSPAEARRVALVIGMSDYQTLSALENPVTDAKAVAAMLKKNGFEVFEYYDLQRADLLDALEEFKQAADASTVALAYYAGHGMEIGGKNIIAPTDMEIDCDDQEARRAVEADSLFEALGTAPQQIVLLDACRNNPFPQCPKRATSSGSGFRGFSRVTAPDHSLLIANATLSGQLAADGTPGEHSPFASALLKHFEASPKMFMRDLLDQTAADVQLASGGSQVPEITTRGGAPKVCLAEHGCGGEVASLSQPKENPGGKTLPQVSREKIAGETFADCTDGCPQMVAVAAGSFLMGAGKDDRDATGAEKPQHSVTIGKPFAVSKFEITFDEWETCALEGGCNGYLPEDGGWGRGKRPAIYVSWDDAKAYVEWLRQKSGQPYRLLTEAEWEYAARAGTTTPYWTGETITTAQADFDDSASAGKRGEYQGRTVDVGSYPPNPYGLFDVHGNVWEWVEDCWNKSHAGAPADGSARGGDCARRVLKGGAWYFEAAYLRAATRMAYPKEKRLNVAGFRVARPLE